MYEKELNHLKLRVKFELCIAYNFRPMDYKKSQWFFYWSYLNSLTDIKFNHYQATSSSSLELMLTSLLSHLLLDILFLKTLMGLKSLLAGPFAATSTSTTTTSYVLSAASWTSFLTSTTTKILILILPLLCFFGWSYFCVLVQRGISLLYWFDDPSSPSSLILKV